MTIIPYRKTIKKHTESLLVAIKECGLDINSERNMYECMFMYREQNARQNHIHSFIYSFSSLSSDRSIASSNVSSLQGAI
jgi:hypothetical protein